MLCDYVETALTAHQIGDLLTMAGFELEGIEVVGDEHVLDIKVMSNRGDGLSVFGLAREVLAKDQASNPTRLYTRAAARFEDIHIAETIQIPAEAFLELTQKHNRPRGCGSDSTRRACARSAFWLT
jgi:hypothetical protein